MRNLITKSAVVVTAIMLSASCGQKQAAEEQSATAQLEHDHEHIYACPMHPEITGKEGDKCPKCGMLLEHNDQAGQGKTFRMDFSSEPSTIEAGKEVMLKLTPKDPENETADVPLDTEHEKKIHLITVSEDLSWFNHTHPEFNADGSYSLKEVFPSGGKYILYADYKPSAGNHQLEKIEVNVSGPAAQRKDYKEESLTSQSGGYSVTLKPDDASFIANKSIHFDGVFVKDGKPFDVNGLQNYLGSKGHMVAINMSTKEYVHLHPEVENTILHFHATFPSAGLYRVWLQFMADDKLHTVDYVVNAVEGAEGTAGDASHSHSGHSH